MSDTMTAYDITCDTFAEQLADYLEGDASGAVRTAVEAHAASCASCGALLADLLAIPQAAAALPRLSPSRDLWHGIAERIDARVLPMDGASSRRRLAFVQHRWMRPAIAAAVLVATAGVTHLVTRMTMTPATSTVAQLPQSRPVAPAAAPQEQVAAVDADTDTDTAAPEAAHPVATRREPAVREATGGRRVAQAPAARRGAAAPRGAVPASLASRRTTGGAPALGAADPTYDQDIRTLRELVSKRRAQLDPATIAVLEQSVAVIDSAIAQSRAALARDPASAFLATQLNHSLEKKIELLRTAALLPART